MPKTYPDIGTFSSGQILTAATMNEVATNLDNQRSPALCRIRRATALSINNATDTFVSFTLEDVDTDGMFTATSDTITIQSDGVYHVAASVYFAANNTGQRILNIYKNPSSVSDFASVIAGQWADATQTLGTTLAASAIASFTASQTIKIGVYQTSGGALNVGDAGFSSITQVSVAWLGLTA